MKGVNKQGQAMNDIRQVILGICAALISVVIIVGSFSLVLTEAGMTVAVIPSPVSTQEPSSGEITLTMIPVSTPEFVSTPTPAGFTAQVALPNVQIALPTETATEFVCVVQGWTRIWIDGGRTFEELADTYQISVEELKENNGLQGLQSEILISEFYMCVPPLPLSQVYPTQIPPTQPSGRCGPPSNWVRYTIQSGDTLYSIHIKMGVSIVALQNANCMGTATLIRTGDTLFVPYVMPSQTPYATKIMVPTNTFESPSQPTDTATTEPVFTPIPTNTPPPAATATPLPTVPLIPTDTPPAPPTLSPSSTPLPTISPTAGDVQPKP